MQTLRSLVAVVVLLLAAAACARAAGGDVQPAVALQEVQEKGAFFLDVRTPGEFAGGHAVGAQLVPWVYGGGRLNPDFVAQVEKITPPDKPVVVICRSGSRSVPAAARLRGAGYKEVYNVLGGSIAWRAAHLPWEGPGH